MTLKQKLVLLFIIILGTFFRFFCLGKIPVSLNWDEVSIGYNAYSLYKTGRDEFSIKYPLFIRSFGDFKSALPSYLTIPFIKYFGLNELVIRLPTAILAVFSLLACFWLAKNLTTNINLSLLTVFLFSFSPWSLHFSRFANEGYLALTFMLWGLALWFNQKKNVLTIIFSSLLFSLAIYTYHNIRIFLPLFIIALILIERKILFSQYKRILIAFFVSLFIFLIPFFLSLKQNNPFLRAGDVSVFAHKEYIDEIMVGFYRYEYLHLSGKRIFNNKVVIFGYTILKKYLEHFSLEFLFLGKEISPRLGLDNIGKLHLVELPFLIYGLLKLFLAKEKRQFYILSSWLLLAPLASTLTFDSPHSLRSLTFLPSFQIITSYGFLKIYQMISKRWRKNTTYAFSLFILILFMFNFGYYLHFYYLYYPENSASFWQDGYKEMVNYVLPIKNNYQNVVVTIDQGQPHIFFAFWGKKDPVDYQKQRQMQVNFNTVNNNMRQLDNIIFKRIDPKKDLCQSNNLIVSSFNELDKYVKPIKTIYLSNRFGGENPVFDISETEGFATSSACLKITEDI